MESSPSSKDNLDAPDSLKLFKLLVAGAGRLGLQEISFGFLGRQAWPKSSILRFDLVPSTRWIRARIWSAVILPSLSLVKAITSAKMALVHGRVLAYVRSEEHTSELQSLTKLVCRLLLE